jgi:hypothetical protein
MSLLDICQNAAEEIGFDAPTSIIGNSDPTAVRLLRLAHRTGAILAKKPFEVFIKEHTFTTSDGEPQYDLPSDYRSLVPNTIWNQTTNKQVWKISPRMWSYEKSAMTGAYEDRFRMLGDDAGPNIGARITIHPVPSAVETIYFQYYSKNWLTSAGTEYSEFQSDNDTVIFDEDVFEMGVIWRLLKSLGQPYFEEKTEFDRELEIHLAQDGATEELHADGNFPALSNIPETGFG